MKIAFLFSGQGAQYPGMMKDITESSAGAKKVYDIANQTLGRSISKLCFSGTQEELNFTHNTQPCVLAADLAAYAAVTELGINPDAVAGFSLGEYAAMVAANVISIEDVFPLIQQRADYMQDAVPIGEGAMAAILKQTEDEVIALCREVNGYVVPANYNCPGQIVVSGEAKAIDNLLEITATRKIRAMKLPVSAPFHCDMMSPAAERLKNPLNEIVMSVPSVPVYMNVDAKPEYSPQKLKEKLVAQANSPVRWEQTLKNMQQDGIDTFIELGPGKTLSGFVKKTLENVCVYHVTDLETLDTTKKALGE